MIALTSPTVAYMRGTTIDGAALIPPGAPTDLTDVKHARMLIADPSLACEYSRDGQQDLDEAQLEASGGTTKP